MNSNRTLAGALLAATLFGFCLWGGACAESEGERSFGPTFDARSGDGDLGADGAGEGGVIPPGDAGSDGAGEGGDGGCVARLAIVGGAGASVRVGVSAYDATSLVTTAVAATSIDSPAAIVALGGAFHAAYFTADSPRELHSVLLSGVTISAGQIGTATTFTPPGSTDARAFAGPALTVAGAQAHVIYAGTDNKYYHGTYTNAWDTAVDPVGGAGGSQSFGPTQMAALGASTKLVVAQTGGDERIYTQERGANWETAAALGMPADLSENVIAPTLINLDAGGTKRLLVYARKTDFKVMASVYDMGAWGAPVSIHANAFAKTPMTAVALAGGGALVAWRGDDTKAYYAVYDPLAGTPWGAPQPFFPAANPALESQPALAAGACGADAVAAFAEVGGGIKVTRRVGGAWQAPVSVTSTGGAKWVGVAMSP